MVVIVLIKSLSAIAKKRPAFYGRILPVLLGLDPSSSAVKSGHVSGVHHTLKNAFLSCLRCTHPGAVPWRNRLVGSLRDLKAGGLAEEALREVSRGNSSIAQDVKPSVEASNSPGIRKRSQVQDVSDLNKDDVSDLNEDSKGIVVGNSSSQKVNADSGRVQQLVSMFSPLVAQVVMDNMPNLTLVRPIEYGNEELVNTRSHPATTQADNLSAYLTDIISRSTNSQLTDSTLETQTDEEMLQKPEVEGEQLLHRKRSEVQDHIQKSAFTHINESL